MRNGATVYGGATSGLTFKPAAIGGGGWLVGGDVSSDGTLVTRCDVAFGYIRGPSDTAWTMMPKLGIGIADNQGKYNHPGGPGAYDVAIAWTNSSVVYIATMGYVYKSTDKGVTWTRTSFAYNADFDPNGSYRVARKKLLVDPAGTAVVSIWNPTASTGGLFYTTDSGTTWTKNSSITASGNSNATMCVDRSSATSGSPARYQTMYVAVGTTIYRSTTGVDGTFSSISYPGINAVMSMVATGGVLIVCDGTDIRRWNGTSWSTVKSQSSVWCLAINYATPSQIVCFLDRGTYLASTDTGATWTTALTSAPTRIATDIPWLATTLEDYMSHGMALFDPSSAGRLIVFEGIGVWKQDAAPLTQDAPLTWTSITKGIENMVTQQVRVTPTGRVGLVVQDRCWVMRDKNQIDTFPSQVGPDNAVSIRRGNDLDYAPENENYLVAVHSNTNSIRMSSDGGKTWASPPTPFLGDAGGGNVAVTAVGKFVFLPSSNRPPMYTLDGGNSWAYCTFAGVSPLPTLSVTAPSGVYTFNADYLMRKVLVADKNNAGVVWLFIYGSDDANQTYQTAYSGLWRSTDYGANFSRIFTGRLTANDFWHSKLLSVPGQSGHLFWCNGDVGLNDIADATTWLLRFSSNNGASWTNLPGIYECEDICVGGAAPGSSYPTIYAYGYSAASDNTARGFFRCTNFNPASPASLTWVKIGSSAYPNGDYSSGVTLGAHPNDTFGRFYVGKAASTLLYADYCDKASAT